MPYASTAELEARYPSLAEQSSTEQLAELQAASSWIDGYCGRTFNLEDAATDRYFAAPDRYVLDLGAFEIGTTADVVIAVDDGTGTYSTTLAASAYRLEPVNAAYASPDARPYTSVRRLNGYWPYASVPYSIQERVKITARYGWPSVPEPVKRSCLALAAAAFENPNGASSESIDGYSVTYESFSRGVIGVPDTVVAWLSKYRRGWAA